jgi:hypothetical protein
MRFGVGKAGEFHRLYEAEDRGVGGDAEREGAGGDHADPRAAHQAADRQPEILPERLEHAPSVQSRATLCGSCAGRYAGVVPVGRGPALASADCSIVTP